MAQNPKTPKASFYTPLAPKHPNLALLSRPRPHVIPSIYTPCKPYEYAVQYVLYVLNYH